MPQIGRVCRRWLCCGTGAVRARQDADHGAGGGRLAPVRRVHDRERTGTAAQLRQQFHQASARQVLGHDEVVALGDADARHRHRQRSKPALAGAVRDLGEVGGNTDGIVTDAEGRLYITDVSRNGIVEYEPRTKSMRLLAADEGVHWPDTPAIDRDGRLVFTASNLNRHFAGQVKPGEERYELWRVSRK